MEWMKSLKIFILSLQNGRMWKKHRWFVKIRKVWRNIGNNFIELNIEYNANSCVGWV